MSRERLSYAPGWQAVVGTAHSKSFLWPRCPPMAPCPLLTTSAITCPGLSSWLGWNASRAVWQVVVIPTGVHALHPSLPLNVSETCEKDMVCDKEEGVSRYNEGPKSVNFELIKREITWVGLTQSGEPFQSGSRSQT